MTRDEFGIEEIRCDTAKELYEELDETNERWADSTWLFRGQNDVRWKLQPSAMRSAFLGGQVFTLYDRLIDRQDFRSMLKEHFEDDSDTYIDRRLALAIHIVFEENIVQAFAELADQAGLTIPLDRYATVGGEHRLLEKQIVRILSSAAVPDHMPESVVYALAQHHQLPTRMLDWTYRPMVAAYFAASRSEYADRLRTRMVVWAIRRRSLANTSLSLVSHLRSQIGYLQAQDGTFLYDRDANRNFMETGHWQPFEHELSKISGDSNVLKFTLPFSRSGDLLKRLGSRRVSKPFLMPSFDNVVSEIMQERIRWFDILES